MVRFLLMSLVLFCAIVSSANPSPLTSTAPPDERLPGDEQARISDAFAGPPLTPELASAALITLIRSPDPGHLKNAPFEKWELGKEKRPNGSHFWRPIWLDLKEHQYRYSLSYGRPPRVCRWELEGTFQLQDGRWIALAPKVGIQALGEE